MSIGTQGGGAADTAATITNTTITGLTSQTQPASGISAVSFGDNSVVVTVRNSTITGLSGVDFGLGFPTAGLAAVTAAPTTDHHPTASLSVQNVLVSAGAGCATTDIGALVIGPSAGLGTQSITSTGGNLSDDNSCAPYFTQPTDQNNVAGLAATLSALADNGGSVPTMALKQGSPAIDSGITIAGLTTDARGQARPQGSAYDSGAYESPYTKPTLAASGQSTVLAIMVSVGAVVSGSLLLPAHRRVYSRSS